MNFENYARLQQYYSSHSYYRLMHWYQALLSGGVHGAAETTAEPLNHQMKVPFLNPRKDLDLHLYPYDPALVEEHQ